MKDIIQRFHGTGVALVTPFNFNGSIDYIALGKLLDHIAPYVNYLVINGTTAEVPTLNEEEKNRILDFIIEKNIYKRLIVWGLGGYSTHHIINSFKFVIDSKIDAILSVSPPYNLPSQQGLIRHYTALADASPVPIILYNVPSRTGRNMEAQTTLKLSKHPNIIGIKEASGNIVQCMTIVNHKPDNFLLISGDDLLTIPLISIGAVGVISVLANVFPQAVSKFVQAAICNDYIRAQKVFYRLFEINHFLFKEGNPAGVKAALEILGIIENVLRLPLVKASDVLYEKLNQNIKKLATIN